MPKLHELLEQRSKALNAWKAIVAAASTAVRRAARSEPRFRAPAGYTTASM